MKYLVGLFFGALLLITVTGIFAQGERPGKHGIQYGPRGTGLVYIYNPNKLAELAAVNRIPPSVPYAGNEGPKASTVYKNVRVLGDVSTGEFTRLMVNMTRWVSPEKGCAACHTLADMSADSLYTKVVARRMLQMVRHINGDWTKHVAQTGVTCYTCHRGQLVPANIWFNSAGPAQTSGAAQIAAGKNHPSDVAGGSALPIDPFTPYLEQKNDVRVQSVTALHLDDHKSMKQTEWTYALMLSMSQSLGVNCDFCHNTRSFADWTNSTPQRVTAWYGIRMVRDLNVGYLDPLKPVFPPYRLGGGLGDSPKVNCATCHNGVYKPLFGISMARNFPELTASP